MPQINEFSWLLNFFCLFLIIIVFSFFYNFIRFYVFFNHYILVKIFYFSSL